jgi:hypothetical protein
MRLSTRARILGEARIPKTVDAPGVSWFGLER